MRIPRRVFTRVTPLRSAGPGYSWAVLMLAVTAVLMTALLVVPGAAWAKEWRVERNDVLLEVRDDGDVLVSETFSIRFDGEFSFVTRSIPVAGVEAIEEIRVEHRGVELDRGDRPGEYEVSREGERLLVRLHLSLADTVDSWKLSYLARGAVEFGDNGDRLRWHVLDAVTPVPVDYLSAKIILPGPVSASDVSLEADTGGVVPVSVASTAEGLSVEAVDLPPRTRLWVVAGFPKGLVDYRWTPRRVAAFMAPKAGLALPLLTLVFLLLVVATRRGGARGAEIYAGHMTEPPAALPPAVAGGLMDGRVGRQEVVASVVDLARRGHFEIVERAVRGRGTAPTGSAVEVTIRRIDVADDLVGLDRVVARGLFLRKRKDTIRATEITGRFRRMSKEFEDEVYGALVEDGYFSKDPGAVRRFWRRVALAVAVATVAAVGAMGSLGLPGWGFLGVGGGVTAVFVLVFSPFMPYRTPLGQEAKSRWEAFRDYLADLERLADFEPAQHLFDRFLPYAIAFGVAEAWARRFDQRAVEAPTWFVPLPDVNAPEAGSIHAGMTGSGLGSGEGISGVGAGIGLAAVSAGLFAGLTALSDAALAGPGSGDSLQGAWAGFNSSDAGSGSSDWSGGDSGGGDSGGGGGGGFDAG